jgi:hypothetical protein
MPWLRHLVTIFHHWGLGSIPAYSVCDSWWTTWQVHKFSPVFIILQVLRAHMFTIYHWCFIFLAFYSVFKQNPSLSETRYFYATSTQLTYMLNWQQYASICYSKLHVSALLVDYQDMNTIWILHETPVTIYILCICYKLKKNQIEIVPLTVFLSTIVVTECRGGKLPYSRTQ